MTILPKLFLLQLKKVSECQIYLPNTKEYKNKVQVYNRAIKNFPLAVVEPYNKNDVVALVRLANKYRVRFCVKGGGHNTAGSSVQTGTLVIDMSKFKRIGINPLEKRVIVEAGVLNNELDDACEPYQLALPLGTCNSVGVVGSTLGGGVGFLSRKFGLVIDNVIKFEIVTGQGKLLNVTKENHSDLFWGLRGAGAGHYGVVISIDYKLWKIPQKVYGGTISWSLSAGKKVLTHYFNVMKEADTSTFLYAYAGPSESGQASVSVFGICLQSKEKSKALFDSFLALAKPIEKNIGFRSYYELQSAHYNEGLAIYWKNKFVKGHPIELVDCIVNAMSECPENMGGIMLDPMGGAIKNLTKNETAFIHRENDYILSCTGIYSNDYVPKKIKQWVNKSMQEFGGYCQSTSYQNYEDQEASDHNQYFSHHSARLSKLKKKYDPHNLIYGILSKSK
ncbi:hypothetical protein C3B51_04765 [Pseudoalteromonas rubra]|uniref:FAD-binding PCMH-type domain-containing protein n=1 Tax=Pseudoalteromonas rubra TaxID=43658 RepID=A0A4Q7EKU7_9GAMM|nr:MULTISPECIES: FAD-dependent oxidoreductase [Pseudoalteromonas]RZM84235.1 hypothetical protein C3B51_04765 [Pseudoalteromonas rubra]TMO54613.1 hypothetical protein CWC21_14635 [Pseudoalteromonas phenolica]